MGMLRCQWGCLWLISLVDRGVAGGLGPAAAQGVPEASRFRQAGRRAKGQEKLRNPHRIRFRLVTGSVAIAHRAVMSCGVV